MPSNKKLLQAAAGSAGGDPLYVEDVFSTYLYTGTGSSLDIDNGIDLNGEGGLVWIKARNNARSHALFDTERGANLLASNLTAAQFGSSGMSANSDGFTVVDNSVNKVNETIVSWTFRKAPGFFDIVTYTGDGTTNRSIPHNLGSVPGFVVIKKPSEVSNWSAIARTAADTYKGGGTSYAFGFNTTEWTTGSTYTAANSVGTSTNLLVGAAVSGGAGSTNQDTKTYIAYIFAHDAQVFGEAGDESIIKCGSYTGNGNTDGPTITLGFEPQWVMWKRIDAADDWVIQDIFRGMVRDSGGKFLRPNGSDGDLDAGYIQPEATGFKVRGTASGRANANGGTYAYMAIRRPMKTPEAGTEVFGLRNFNETNDYQQLPTGNLVDLGWEYLNANGNLFFTRMIGQGYLNPTTNGAGNTSAASAFDFMDGFEPHYANNVSGYSPRMVYGFTRATGFMEVLCYTGDGGRRAALTHNLGAVPELVIVKSRSSTGNWFVLSTSLGQKGFLNNGDGFSTADIQYAFGDGTNYVAPTSTALQVDSSINGNTQTFVAYLFATVAGVSKVGTYTGTGTTHNIDCGFTGGARFVMIKRADGSTNTGDWYVYDSARGISAGNDPYYFLNTTAAQVTNTDYIDPLNAGFTITSGAPAALNASSGTFIFLAIA